MASDRGAGASRASLLLAIDVSNTGVKYGLFPLADGPLRSRWRVATVREKTTDEYAMLLAQLCAHAGYSFDEIGGVIIASVTPSLTPVFQEMASSYLRREAVVITHETPIGVPLLTDNPWETGADRIISARAAHEMYGGPAIAIQFGTATSFDCVSVEGAFLGGAIAPGLGISAEALARAASRLYQVELAPPPAALGKNTTHSMQSGIVYGHVGLVEGLVARLRSEIASGERAKVIAHGGLAGVMAKVTPCIDIVEPNLILIGLNIAWRRLRGADASGEEAAR